MTEAVSSISLVNDPTVIGRLNSERVMVAVPLLYLFMVIDNSNNTDSLFVSGAKIDQKLK